VCVLERGRRFGGGDFPDRPEVATRLIWHPRANPGGMFDIRLMHDIVVITAAGVGAAPSSTPMSSCGRRSTSYPRPLA
jgi:hypothetical protein